MRSKKIRQLTAALLIVVMTAWPALATNFLARPAVGGASITTDFWEDFETDTVNATNLGNQDHNDDGGTWTVVDTGTRLSTSTSGQKAFTSQIASDGASATSDSGTRGLATAMNATAAAYCKYAWASAPGQAAVSFSFWYKIPTLAADLTEEIFSVRTNLDDPIVRVALLLSGGTYTFRLRGDGSYEDDSATVSSGTWYRVEIKVVGTGTDTCLMKIYNEAGSQVGAGVAVSPANGGSQNYFVIGGFGGSNPGNSGTSYVDNFIADKTDATHPLGP